MVPLCAALALSADLAVGTWNARFDTPRGPLPFRLEIAREEAALTATIVNGDERIDVPMARDGDGAYRLDFPHYASSLVVRADESGRELAGEWTKLAGADKTRRLVFHAALAGRAVEPDAAARERIARVGGRWRVHFEGDAEPAVAVFAASRTVPGEVVGTFLTATGDYRYLAGGCGEQLVLACFDGSHAFRFGVEPQPDGSLKGTFDSGNWWSDTWTAVRDDAAKIEGEYERSHWNATYAWNELRYPTPEGELVSLGDPRYAGRVRILQLTGSWCPNCHDETALLAELDREYRARGLSITALCFELTGNRDTDSRAARSLLARHHAEYEVLVAGRSDRPFANEALPALDRVFAFPTTIFVGRDGAVRLVHAGFSGPATGDAYRALREDFRKRVEALLGEEVREDGALQEAVTRELWRDELPRTLTSLERPSAGPWRFTTLEMTRFDRPTRMEPLETGEVGFFGTTVRFGSKLYAYDRHAHVLLDPDDCGHRLTPGTRSPFPVIDGVGFSEFPQILDGLSSGDAIRRRDSAYYLALQLVTDRLTPPEFGGGHLPEGVESNLLPLLADPDPRVRATASWAAGFTGLGAAVDALAKNLDHGFAPVRREAARALGRLQPQAAAEKLAGLAAHDLDPLVREAAAR